MDGGAAETTSIQLVSVGKGWGWSSGCENSEGRGLKVLAGRGLRKEEVRESDKVQEGRVSDSRARRVPWGD